MKFYSINENHIEKNYLAIGKILIPFPKNKNTEYEKIDLEKNFLYFEDNPCRIKKLGSILLKNIKPSRNKLKKIIYSDLC